MTSVGCPNPVMAHVATVVKPSVATIKRCITKYLEIRFIGSAFL